jgi:hypothetical protein
MTRGDAGRLVGSVGLAVGAAVVVTALTLSAAAAGQWLPQPMVAARPPSGPTREAAPPDRGATDLGTAYAPFIIGWRNGPAAAPARGLSPGVALPPPTPTDR